MKRKKEREKELGLFLKRTTFKLDLTTHPRRGRLAEERREKRRRGMLSWKNKLKKRKRIDIKEDRCAALSLHVGRSAPPAHVPTGHHPPAHANWPPSSS